MALRWVELFNMKIFERLDREELVDIKQFKVDEDNGCVDALIKGFEKALAPDYLWSDGVMGEYLKFESCLPKKYCAKDISLFSLIVKNKFPAHVLNGDFGLYISSAIASLKQEKVKIFCDDFCPYYLGYNNKDKHIEIYGNAGKYVAEKMGGGDIYISGDLESISLDISGGDIYHNGECILKGGVSLK